ncbi:hypothetical protein GIB67_010163 [Kingdonia uniflora]|uniref:Uncharacterized protein n=1 Tax=Kingdonia uniflora TaxID=39325 RepID=A0A7J7NAS7_9MAGN|nr:hypothetical protein GIB67_010163 [Kingdonia uniflora]
MEYALQLQSLCRTETRRIIFFTGIIAITVLVIQTLTLPYGYHFSSSFPGDKVALHETRNFRSQDSSPESATVPIFPLSYDSKLIGSSLVPEMVKHKEASFIERESERDSEMEEEEGGLEKDGGSESAQELDFDRNSDGKSSPKELPEGNGLDKKSLKTNIEVRDASNNSRMLGNPIKKVSHKEGV